MAPKPACLFVVVIVCIYDHWTLPVKWSRCRPPCSFVCRKLMMMWNTDVQHMNTCQLLQGPAFCSRMRSDLGWSGSGLFVSSDVMPNGQSIRHELHSVYLGVTLDCTVNYKQHLTKIANKVKSHNSLLTKRANSSWGANANTLRSSLLALCYSVAEVLLPSMGMLVTHRCVTQLPNAHRHWDPALCTTAMATCSVKHRTTTT